MVRRHVRQGLETVTNQHALIARLAVNGLPTEEAEVFLASFEDIQRLHEAHLVRLEGR